MRYNARCSRCGVALAEPIQEQKTDEHGHQFVKNRRPNWGQARYTVSAPVGLDEDGMGFNEYIAVRLGKLTLPLCVRQEDDELGGCFFELVEMLEAFWTTSI